MNYVHFHYKNVFFLVTYGTKFGRKSPGFPFTFLTSLDIMYQWSILIFYGGDIARLKKVSRPVWGVICSWERQLSFLPRKESLGSLLLNLRRRRNESFFIQRETNEEDQSLFRFYCRLKVARCSLHPPDSIWFWRPHTQFIRAPTLESLDGQSRPAAAKQDGKPVKWTCDEETAIMENINFQAEFHK